MSAPLTPVNWVAKKRNEYSQRIQEHRSGGGTDLDGMLWHYVPFAWLAPSNRRPFRSSVVFETWQKFTWPDIIKAVAARGFDNVDLLVLDTIFQPFWLDEITYRRSVVRLADFNAGFRGYAAGARMIESRLILQADLVVTASEQLKIAALANGAREALYLPNGIDFDRFAAVPDRRPVEYLGMERLIAVFVGDIREWVDLSLVKFCARARPDVSFVLVGPVSSGMARKYSIKNVHFLGAQPPERIPGFLGHASVGLIPFSRGQHQSLIAHVNPLKLYEYLAAGLPVVSTRWPEIENLQSPARLCDSREAFLQAVNESLEGPHDAERFRNFARASDWRYRTTALMDWANLP